MGKANRVALMVGAVLALAVPVTAQQSDRDFRWTGRLAAGQWIEVKGIIGSIDAQPASGNEVEVTAIKREGRRGRVEDVRIEAVRHDDGVTICALYPSRRGRENECDVGDRWHSNNDDNDVRVDFVVRVPRGVHFMGRTVSGSVDAIDLPADAKASSVSGDVEVSAAGVVEASTVSGSIRATMGSARPGRDLSFNTVSGSITLYVPANFQADFDAETLSGDIDSDFPISVRRHRYVGVSAYGRIGDRGGHALSMETVSGSIRLRRTR
jgi:hypothetical protein